MTADFLAWSHSRRKTFLDCPKQLYHTAVVPKHHTDRVPFEQSQAMLDGNAIDDALTARINGMPLPPKFAQWEGMAQAVIAAPGIKFTQLKIALDQTFAPCGYMDWDRTWVRAIYDVAVIDGAHAFIGDWKNGQVWIDEDQLKLFAATAFHQFPEVETVDTSYIWLKHGITSDAHYRRRELPQLWADLLPDVERMQVAFKTNHWPATPSKRACKYCSVNKAGKCDVAAVKFGENK